MLPATYTVDGVEYQLPDRNGNGRPGPVNCGFQGNAPILAVAPIPDAQILMDNFSTPRRIAETFVEG